MPRARVRTVGALLSAAILILSCGRGGERPQNRVRAAREPPVESADAPARARRPARSPAPVIWIGLDGLDWELLDRLAAERKMPNWSRVVREGRTARLASFLPLLSPILWTTAATGMGPETHGVLDFQEVDPATGRKVPISGFSREVPAVWNLASSLGRSVGVVGWWATHPAEEVNGFFVSDRVSPILFPASALQGAAFPTSLDPMVERALAAEEKVDAADLSPYLGVPDGEIASALGGGAGMENPVAALGRVLSATRTTQRLARDLYDRRLPDLVAVYFEGTDEVGHLFASSTPPRLACASSDDVSRYGRAVETYYAAVDRILGQWMRRAEEDGATLLVHSDHGFKWGSDRPCGFASKNWKTAAFWHRPEGVLAAWGPRVRRASGRGDASLFDVAPTVLALLGLPRDSKMAGRVLRDWFEEVPTAPPSRGPVSVAVRRVAARETSPREAEEYAKKLLALGYLSPRETAALAPTGGSRPGRTEGAWNNLGVYERDTRKNPAAARVAFEKALALRPDYYSPMFNLAVLERSAGNARAAEDRLIRSLKGAGGDPAPVLEAWAAEYEQGGRSSAAESLLARAVREWPDSEPVARDLGLVRFRGGDCRGAVAALARYETETREPRTLNALALFQTCLRDRAAVVRLLERSLAVKPDQPEVARSLARARGN